MSKVEGRSASNCRRNGVNPAISAKGTTLNKKLNNYYFLLKDESSLRLCFVWFLLSLLNVIGSD